MSEEDIWSIPEFDLKKKEEEERKNLREKVGETVTFKSVRFEESKNFGKFIVLDCKEGMFYNFSKRLQEQLKPYADVGKLRRPIKAKVMLSDRNQIYFTRPDSE